MTVGYRDDPDALAEVIQARCATKPDGVGRRYDSPARIIPQRGQVSENGSEPPSSESWRVLHEDVVGFHFANDSDKFLPQSAAWVFESESLPSDADALTGKSARNHVNNASPRASVEGADIVPDRERRERAVVLPSQEDFALMLSDLDGADGAPAEQFPAEDAAAGPGEESELA